MCVCVCVYVCVCLCGMCVCTSDLKEKTEEVLMNNSCRGAGDRAGGGC